MIFNVTDSFFSSFRNQLKTISLSIAILGCGGVIQYLEIIDVSGLINE